MASKIERSYSLRMSRRGRPEFTIVQRANACPVEEFAAEELGRTLFSIIGPGSRVRSAPGLSAPWIVINDPEAAQHAGIDLNALDLGKEMFHIETRGSALHLLGGGPRGVLYGVYHLLESLGCRWYTPEISQIPRLPDLALPPLNITSAPAFENRDTFNTECRDPLWRVRNRMNGWSVPTPEYMGGNLDYCGFVHTFYSLLPPEEFFDAHPEYYSLVGGQRRRDQAQLCLTNPDVLRIVTRRVLDRMKAHPRATIFSVSQNDCYGFCECDACRAVAAAEGSQSGPILRFVNAVAAGTDRQYPDRLIDTLAYQYSLDAPRITVPHPNVRVRLCSINCCQGHALGTCDHPESRRFLRALQDWSQRTAQIYIWHYATDFTHYPLPMPDFDELHGNINLYRQSGVRGLFIQGMGEGGGWAESMALRGYVVSRLLWKPEQPVWPIVDEFLPAYYGAAAPQVRQYLEIFHRAVREDRALHPSLYDLPSSRLYADDLRHPAEEALVEAEGLVSGVQKERVRLLCGGLRYARLFRACGTFQRSGETYAGAAVEGDRQEMDNLVRLWKRAGVQRIREAEDFDFTVQKLRSRLRAHKVEFLEGERQTIAVIPGLGGRLIAWQAKGHQWLAPADPDSTWSLHPFSGGYSEMVIWGMYASRGWGEVYRAAWRGSRLHLSALAGAELEVSRQLWLDGAALHLHTRLRNGGIHPLRVAWGASIHLCVPAPAQLRFQSAEGETDLSWAQMADGESLQWTGEKAPRNTWQISTSGGQLTQTNEGGIARFNLRKQSHPARLALDWQTAMITLAPGEDLPVRQVIQIS